MESITLIDAWGHGPGLCQVGVNECNGDVTPTFWFELRQGIWIMNSDRRPVRRAGESRIIAAETIKVEYRTAPTGIRSAWHFTATLLLLIFAIPFEAQEATSPPNAVFRTSYNLVVLDVVVTDRAGKSVTDLTPGDFTVTEDGAAQTIASFETPLGLWPIFPVNPISL